MVKRSEENMATVSTTKDQKEHTFMTDIKEMSDQQLRALSNAVKKEIGDRFRAKHCDGMFTFDGRPMSRTQAIDAFVLAKEKKETGLEKVLKKLSKKDKAYLTHMGDLHHYALRSKNDAGAKRVYSLMVEKLVEYHMEDKTDKIIKRFYS
jgi:hypothetical protein